MINTKDHFEQTVKELSEIEPLIPVMAEIKKVVDWFVEDLDRFDNLSPDQISKAVAKLAALRVNLGVEMAKASSLYDLAYIERKFRYAAEWKPTKQKLYDLVGKATIQDIEAEVQKKINDQILEEQRKKQIAETLKAYYDTSETLITALQSRLGVLKAERFESRHG